MDRVSTHGVVGSDNQNTPDAKGVHTRSRFSEDDLGYSFYATLPFGEVRPFTFFESVPDDKDIRAQFLSQVNSYTLKAPLMQGIHMKKLLAQVPREAILPFNWEKWFKNPVIGQDIANIAPDAGTSVLGFWHIAYGFFSAVKNSLPNSTTVNSNSTASAYATAWFRYLLMAEMFYSDGNLLKHCNISGRPWCYSLKSDGRTHNSIDYVFDKFVAMFIESVSHTSDGYFWLNYSGGVSYRVDINADPNKVYSDTTISIREMLALMRDDLTFTLDFTSWLGPDWAEIDNLRVGVNADVEFSLVFKDDNPTDPGDAVAVDLKRLWAYQLVVAHFLTNDSVDFVFSAELFRSYVYELVTRVYVNANQSVDDCFTVNGLSYHYDYLSAHYFSKVFLALTYYYTNGTWPGLGGSTGAVPDSLNEALAYLCALFSFRRSLRYLDYFTGSKTRPLAVGDVNVQVNAGMVNVVDTQAKTFLARMLNVINRSGIRGYMEAIFNVRQAPDWHNPQYLVKIDDIITGERIENTASEQWSQPNSVTSLLHGNSDRFAFEMDFDRSSIVIGLVWFDIDRVYSMATERVNLHYDRFDEFQPFMQYTGDQSLMRVELGTPLVVSSLALPTDPFGYKLRNCEYKERFDQCAGGFCNDMLDGYLFKADVLESIGVQNQSPAFIRSFPSELDRFYLSLTGYSLATYFHFIVKFVNLYSGSRPMAYAPTLM